MVLIWLKFCQIWYHDGGEAFTALFSRVAQPVARLSMHTPKAHIRVLAIHTAKHIEQYGQKHVNPDNTKNCLILSPSLLVQGKALLVWNSVKMYKMDLSK